MTVLLIPSSIVDGDGLMVAAEGTGLTVKVVLPLPVPPSESVTDTVTCTVEAVLVVVCIVHVDAVPHALSTVPSTFQFETAYLLPEPPEGVSVRVIDCPWSTTGF